MSNKTKHACCGEDRETSLPRGNRNGRIPPGGVFVVVANSVPAVTHCCYAYQCLGVEVSFDTPPPGLDTIERWRLCGPWPDIRWSRSSRKRCEGKTLVNMSANCDSVGKKHMLMKLFSTWSRNHHIRIAKWRLREETTGLVAIWMHAWLSSRSKTGGTGKRSSSHIKRASHRAVLLACTAATYSASAVLKHTIVESLLSHMMGQPCTQTT